MQVTLKTNGRGYWTQCKRAVEVVDIKIRPYSRGDTFAELRVYFNTESWDTRQHGLVYTDKQFMKELREFVTSQGLPGKDLDYSEQGMQGDDYVSCDIGSKFIAAWFAKFGI